MEGELEGQVDVCWRSRAVEYINIKVQFIAHVSLRSLTGCYIENSRQLSVQIE